MTLDRLADGYEPTWDIDADVGRQGELAVADVMAAPKRGASVEVKTDEKFLETGNVFFEYCCKKTSSWESAVGDYLTELWVHVLGPDGGHLVLDVAALKVAARRLRADGYTKARRRLSPDSRRVRGC